VSLGAGAVLATVTAASAYWSGAGAGSGTAGTAAATLSVSLTPGTPTAQLYPGSTAAVVLTISNPDQASLHVSALALDTSQGAGGFAVDGAHSGCTLDTLSFSTQTNGGAGWTVPGGGSLPVTLPGALVMGATAADACQGATFSVYLSAGA
jgi:hypothetical protein